MSACISGVLLLCSLPFNIVCLIIIMAITIIMFTNIVILIIIIGAH